ncbi:hypothetical protein [Bradyrhizobium sp. dw_411]|uniref:hypothetical protein n=1 Tax=Bradyrhizobium sp. dw_411 TaxID=2720082 RepID=UPI001BD19274|nr:hypothetical protein [Bradyrhizobium sp. dw_411]
MAAARSLFSTKKPKKLLHPSFETLSSSPWSKSTRRMMNDAFARFVERDGNFIEQFQTTGFNTRTFELFVSELLHAEGFVPVGNDPQPDFTVEKDGLKLSIECTTANPSGNDSGLLAYRIVNARDADLADIRDRQHNTLPIRIAGALRAKMLHRVDKKNGGKAYWELPHVAGHPFVLAIQTFHEHGSLAFSNAGVIRYLYGIEHRPSWDGEGSLVIETNRVEQHRHEEKEIPSGFFNLEGSENVSAVLWTNAGTVPTFTRMAITGPYPDGDVSMVRFGNMIDHDPNAHIALPFAFIVADEDAPPETWGTGANLFHNPRANCPLPLGLFGTVTDSTYIDGVYMDTTHADFIPIMSLSNSFRGPGHLRIAERRRDDILSQGMEAYMEQLQKGTAG